jgi:hypothetical protein
MPGADASFRDLADHRDLYWEPKNADAYEVFRQHRQEIKEFESRVADPLLRFDAKSYPELWSSWMTAPHA